MSRGMARCRDDPQAVRQLMVSVKPEVLRIGRADPISNRIPRLGRGLELRGLRINGHSRKQTVVAAVVEMEVGVDDGAYVFRRNTVLRKRRWQETANHVVLLIQALVGLTYTGVKQQYRIIAANQKSENGARLPL